MEYPNKNLQKVMKAEAHRASREAALFGEGFNAISADHPFSAQFTFKRYGSTVLGLFDRKG